MSIEKNIERIANALEKIADNTTPVVITGSSEAVVIEKKAPAPAPVSESTAPASEAPVKVPAPAPAPAAESTAPLMSPDELNEALGVEYIRLGETRDPIDAAMKAMGVDSIATLQPDQYQTLLDAVRAITVPAATA